MSNPDPTVMQSTAEDLRSYIRDVTLNVIWRQWHAVGGMTSSDRRTKSLVDPEALVLMSLGLQGSEPRLADVLGDWATINSDLLSVQRLRNLAKRFSPSTQSAVGSFARIAYEDGKDHRWKAIIEADQLKLKRRPPKGSGAKRAARARPLESAALMLRLRLAFGVGIKADTLSFLLSTEQEAWASVGVIAAATDYSVAAVRKAAQNLVEARFVEQMADPSAEYHVDHQGWRELLGVKSLPTWRGWAVRFAFVSAFLEWIDDVQDRSMTPYVFESRGLALLQKHERAFRWQGVSQRIPRSFSSDGDFQVETAIHDLGKWMEHVS